MKSTEESVFAEQLIAWYHSQQRDLPWRHTYDPYHIWISEIMLQQTQMDRGVSYFNRWIERFPDVDAVAAADEQEILRYWQGLGYYARARNIHRAAQKIVQHFAGRVPNDYQNLLNLPGIGTYTAAAIASIAGNHDIAVVDTNVCRVYARLFDIAANIKKREGLAQVQKIATDILPKGRSRHYNQAIMDFGGLLCLPRNPRCNECFAQEKCRSFIRGVVNERPVLPTKKEKVLQHKLTGLIFCEGYLLLRQRGKKELWPGLWDFPGTLLLSIKKNTGSSSQFFDNSLSDLSQVSARLSSVTQRDIQAKKFLARVKHQFTHHSRVVDCWLCETRQKKLASNERWVCWEQITEYGLPAGARKIVELLRKSPQQLNSMERNKPLLSR